MSDSLKILFISAEVAPILKTGGLADVANALPRKLHDMGHDVRLAMPCYGTIAPEYLGRAMGTCIVDINGRSLYGAVREGYLPDSDVPIYFIEHDGFFNREHPYNTGGREFDDNALRFSFFNLAVLDAMRHLKWRPDVVHCHDWHTAVTPAYLKTRYFHDDFWGGMPSLFTIHNLAYQGRYPAWQLPDTGLGWELFHPNCLEFYGDINLMKAAICFASQISTVSRRYASEIQTPDYGYGLDGFLRTRSEDISGILNGVDYDEWSPINGKDIPAPYSAEDLSGKAVCKSALQRKVGLPVSDAPLFGMVSRFDRQKGLDLIAEAMEELVQQDVQLMFLGTGDKRYETIFAAFAKQYPEKVAVSLRYDARLAHEVHAGADFFLMPSLFEPSGLSQLYSLAYGCVPIVRKTGGLADSIGDCSRGNLESGQATGIVFAAPTSRELLNAVARAIRLYQDKPLLDRVRISGMKQDFSWDRAATAYVDLYRKAMERP